MRWSLLEPFGSGVVRETDNRCRMKRRTSWALIACVVAFAGGAGLAEDKAAGVVRPLRSVQFSPDNDVKCLSSAVETGDPTTGRSTLILKAPSGCVVPWHFHTAEEQLLVVSGAVLAEMRGLGPAGLP